MKKNEKKRNNSVLIDKVEKDIEKHKQEAPRYLSSIVPTSEQEQHVKKYEITGRELRAVLHSFGATQREFAKLIGKSDDTVSLICRASYSKIKYRYAKILEEMVGTEFYMTIIAKDRQIRMNNTLTMMMKRKDELQSE